MTRRDGHVPSHMEANKKWQDNFALILPHAVSLPAIPPSRHSAILSPEFGGKDVYWWARDMVLSQAPINLLVIWDLLASLPFAVCCHPSYLKSLLIFFAATFMFRYDFSPLISSVAQFGQCAPRSGRDPAQAPVPRHRVPVPHGLLSCQGSRPISSGRSSMP